MLITAVIVIVALVGAGVAAFLLTRSGDTAEAEPQPGVRVESSADIEWVYGRDRFGRTMQTAPGTKGVALPQIHSPSDLPEDAAPFGLTLQPSGTNGGSSWYSTSDGPTSVSADGAPSGFARTPQGAALAATWSVSLLADWDALLAALDAGFLIDATPDGRARDNVVRGLESVRQNDLYVAPWTTSAVRIIEYGNETAQVEVAVGAESGGLSTVIVDLKWVGHSWSALVTGDAGQPGRNFDRIPDDFVIWSVG